MYYCLILALLTSFSFLYFSLKQMLSNYQTFQHLFLNLRLVLLNFVQRDMMFHYTLVNLKIPRKLKSKQDILEYLEVLSILSYVRVTRIDVLLHLSRHMRRKILIKWESGQRQVGLMSLICKRETFLEVNKVQL